MQKAQDWKSWTSLVLVAFLTLSISFSWFAPATVDPVSAGEIALATSALIILPEFEAPDTAKIDEIHTKILEDDAWEDEAEELATKEWSERDNKDLFRAINDFYDDLDDEDEIIYVREDESTEFSRMDADDKDGVVTQYLKVKYEDDSGDDQKVYITVETTFDEGDLDDQEFFITE